MEKKTKSTTTMIVGARAGIGAGIAEVLRKNGHELILIDVEPCIAQPGNTVIVSDFFSPRAQTELFANLQDRPIDYLVCGPYVPHTKKPLAEMSDQELTDQLLGNLAAPLTLARRFMAHPGAQADRGIIFIGSEQGGSMLRPYSIGYDVAKAGLRKATEILARECIEATLPIRVNLIEPGATDTPGEREHADEKSLRSAWQKLPAGRPCTPEEIGAAIYFLTSQPMMNGEIVRMNGGEHLVAFT